MSAPLNLEPDLMEPSNWQSRFASLKSRGTPDDDPRIVECQRALSFWRVKRAIEAERHILGDVGVHATTALLLDIVVTEAAS